MKLNKYSLLIFTFLFLQIVIPSLAQTSLLDETTTVEDNQMRSFTANLVKDVIYSVDIQVVSGPSVDLVVLDDLNFGKYQQAFISGSTVSFEYFLSFSALNTKGKSFTMKLTEDTKLNFVIENANFIQNGASGGSAADVSLKLTAEAKDATGFEFLLVLFALPVASLLLRRRK